MNVHPPANSDDVDVLSAAIEIEVPNCGEICIAPQSSTELRKDFIEDKTHGSLGWLSRGVGYAKVGYEGFYCIVFLLQISNEEIMIQPMLNYLLLLQLLRQ